MSDLEKMPPTTLGIKWEWPAVHPEGRKFAVIAAVIAAAFWFFDIDAIAWLMVGVTIWVAAFFRDPVRSVPQHPSCIISPADGMVSLIQLVPPPPELVGEDGLGDQPLTRVSVFMSVFDVHINRSPIAGKILRIRYIPGSFLNADLDKASEENERQHFLVEREDGLKIGFTQIAGLIARRIMTFSKEGDAVTAGQRIGLIRFGSRVDVYLPAGTAPRVSLGQRCIAGETILGILGDDVTSLGARQ